MARIIVGSYMVRFPLGGMLSWALQYLLGLARCGHEVFFVEKANYPNACYDPVLRENGDDCRYGIKVVSELLARFELSGRWCFVDHDGNYWGKSPDEVRNIFKTADLFIDGGSHGSWAEESAQCRIRVLIDGEPAYTQFKWMNRLADGIDFPEYDHYFTNGRNVGSPGNSVPTLDLTWRHIFNPVDTTVFLPDSARPSGAYTTIMNWQSHSPIEFNGLTYGQKDVEFARFESLPQHVKAPMAVAVSGRAVPHERLKAHGWAVLDAQAVTESFDSFVSFLSSSRGEFSVCKNIFVQNKTGWFSDRSAAYLASGRPVILQDTGFSEHLPTGEGLVAVNTVEEAAEAIRNIESDYESHSRRAREIACEYLDAKFVMGRFLRELGIH